MTKNVGYPSVSRFTIMTFKFLICAIVQHCCHSLKLTLILSGFQRKKADDSLGQQGNYHLLLYLLSL